MYNKKRKNGFVLITVLCFLTIFSLLGINIARTTAIELKSSQYLHRRNQLFYAAESTLNEVAADNKTYVSAPCLLKSHDANYYIERPWYWWETHGSCHIAKNPFEFRYIIEKISEETCAKINGRNSSFYRISLFANDKEYKAIILLQAVYAIPGQHNDPCKELTKEYPILAGRQSWREVQNNT